MNILTIDIETSPNLAHVWGIWQQNVGLPQLLEATEVLCAAGKWYGEGDTLFTRSIEDVWEWLDKADVVVSYNGRKFDIPHLNREFLEREIAPPSPFKQIDLLQTSKSKFRFPSNKLDYIAQKLGIGQKIKHAGHQLWVDCMAGNKDAWAKMEEYNREDVVLTEKLYERFKPWIQNHPNILIYDGVNESFCTRCGSENTVRQGYAYTNLSKFQQYQCKDCGSWFRGRSNLAERDKIGANIL